MASMFISDELWLAYKNTRFKWQGSPLTSTAFAIITAHNPRSEVFPPDENEGRQCCLIAEIESYSWRYTPLIAGDEDSNYSEASIAVACLLPDAVEVARGFDQNAIFYVNNDLLSLVPVLLSDRKEEAIGSFSQHIIVD